MGRTNHGFEFISERHTHALFHESGGTLPEPIAGQENRHGSNGVRDYLWSSCIS